MVYGQVDKGGTESIFAKPESMQKDSWLTRHCFTASVTAS